MNDPDAFYREWVATLTRAGLTSAEIADLAELEGVTSASFRPLSGRVRWQSPEGASFFLVEDAADSRELARLTELLAGGRPSTTDHRRAANRWTYTSLFGLGTGDVGLVLGHGGAVVTTPEGILMAAPGPAVRLGLPNIAALFAGGAGTAWGEMFIINGAFAEPARVLQAIIQRGALHGNGRPPLPRLLRHERIHAEQWARLGYARFIVDYLRHNPLDPCHHPLEQEAGLGDGGYFRCMSEQEVREWEGLA